MDSIIGCRGWDLWLFIGLVVSGCGATAASPSATAYHGSAASVPMQSRSQLAQELHDHAAYLRQVADRRDEQADQLARKVGPEDEGIIFRTRSLADQIRRQADEADRKARELSTASSHLQGDHAMIAQFYEQESQRLASEAEKYAEEAAAIDPLQDPKGIRRGELLTAAQQHRHEAAEMKQRAASHTMKVGQ